MTFKYALKEEDFTYAYMFNVNSKKSARITRQIVRIVYPGIFIVLAVKYRETYQLALFFIVVSILGFVFFDKLSTWQLKSKCKRMLRKQPQSYVGQPIVLTFTNNHLWIKDLTGEQCLNHNDILQITEVKDYFIIDLSNGLSMPIPKSSTDINEARTYLETIDIPFIAQISEK